ncbi:hypothetical protein Tco_0327619, partial [Tanacetum coccineum]
ADIAKISRKRSKPDKHRHENRIECARAGRMLSKSYTSSKAPIGQFPKGNDTRTRKETHKGVGFCTKTLTKEAQECHITDCHAGNPCDLRFDLTDHNGDPIIGRNGGTGFKGAHAEFDESNTHVLERFYTSAGNPVKEILLKLNLPDHRKLKDGGEVLKLKNFKKDATLKLFKSTNQERYEHVGLEVTSSQDGKVTRWQNEIMLG